MISSCAQFGPDEVIYACGVVLDKATETPIHGPTVAMAACGSGAYPNSNEIAHADAEGNFEVSAPPPEKALGCKRIVKQVF